jgi:predicted murein hydrolase (TIGR00659 family)
VSDASRAWDVVTASPVFGVALTLAAYQAARWLWLRTGRHPLANPVLVAVAIIGVTLRAGDVPFGHYLRGGSLITFLLGPATVALAWPLHQELGRVRRAAVPVLAGVTLGAGTAVAVGIWLTRILGGSDALARSMAPKSATTAVSVSIARSIDAIPSLTAVLTILAGILGAVAGPRLLTLLRIRDPRARGLAVGVASHGIGTAQMLHENRTAGAFSGLAMALSALATSLWVPVLVPLLT